MKLILALLITMIIYVATFKDDLDAEKVTKFEATVGVLVVIGVVLAGLGGLA